jgi:hypothetical protein
MSDTQNSNARTAQAILSDLKKRFEARHSFSDKDVQEVQADLSELEQFFTLPELPAEAKIAQEPEEQE